MEELQFNTSRVSKLLFLKRWPSKILLEVRYAWGLNYQVYKWSELEYSEMELDSGERAKQKRILSSSVISQITLGKLPNLYEPLSPSKNWNPIISFLAGMKIKHTKFLNAGIDIRLFLSASLCSQQASCLGTFFTYKVKLVRLKSVLWRPRLTNKKHFD